MSLRTESIKTVSDQDIQLSKIALVNDSLKTALERKNSTIDSLQNKLADIQAKKDKDKPKVYASKKTSNLTKDQEYERKSQFVYNFAAYIEWPVIYNGTEFVIGIAGDDDVVKKIKSTIGDKKVGGKKLRIEKYNKVTNYHLVYVTTSYSASFANIKTESKKNKTIIISDDYALFDAGAQISFIMNDDKVKYTINKTAIEKIGLKVSQELMRFSE
ncbi:hypothetical protein BH10BAC1_BH10BAC1_06850 [soil metagenome]